MSDCKEYLGEARSDDKGRRPERLAAALDVLGLILIASAAALLIGLV
jgi:hypothetical protein